MEQTDAVENVVKTSKPTSSINPVLTGNDLVDKMNEIKNIPFRTFPFNLLEIDSITWNCGDSLYWEIVQLGQDAIPYLITKVQDSTMTDIQIPCREINLTVGTIAFIALNNIIDIPNIIVFECQCDVFMMNCDFEYPIGLLEYINKNPQEVHEKLMKWYEKYGKTIKKKKLKKSEQNVCQKKHGIDYEFTIKYE